MEESAVISNVSQLALYKAKLKVSLQHIIGSWSYSVKSSWGVVSHQPGVKTSCSLTLLTSMHAQAMLLNLLPNHSKKMMDPETSCRRWKVIQKAPLHNYKHETLSDTLHVTAYSEATYQKCQIYLLLHEFQRLPGTCKTSLWSLYASPYQLCACILLASDRFNRHLAWKSPH